MPVILVELPAADRSDPNVPALIRACTEGLHAGKCALDQGEETLGAVAIVSWLDEGHERARLEVVSRTEEHAAWHSRELAFHEHDAAVERWRALGFAIAGLVSEVSPSAPSSKPRVEPKPRREAVPSRTEEPQPTRPWYTALGVELGRGLAAAPTTGVWLGLGRRCYGPLELLASATERWGVTSSQAVSARFTTVGLGLGLELEPAPSFALESSLWAVVDTLHVKAVDASGAEASAHRSLLGAALRLDAIWPARSALAGSLGGELLSLSGATGIRLFSQGATESPALRWSLRAGLRFRF